jgi:hypothetical protein
VSVHGPETGVSSRLERNQSPSAPKIQSMDGLFSTTQSVRRSLSITPDDIYEKTDE